MLSLISKELVVTKKVMLFGLGYSIFIFFAFSASIFQPFVYVMGGLAVAYMMVLTSVQTEYKNNTDIILNSLPVTRREIILSKYITIFLDVLIALLMVGGMGLLVKILPLPFGPRLLNGMDIIITFDCVLFLSAIMIPVYYKTGGRWAQIINMVFFMLLFFGPSNIFQFLMKNREVQWVEKLYLLHSLIPGGIPAALAVVVFLLTALSFFVSLRIYERKDF